MESDALTSYPLALLIMTLSIIILSYRNPALLRLCLNSLRQALADTSLTYEVIVVDNATTPETANVALHDFADAFPSLQFIPLRTNTGYTHGVNEGLRAARGEYLLPLNYDIITRPRALESMVAYLADHPTIGLLGPQLLNFDGTRQDSCFRFYTPAVILARRLGIPFTRRLQHRFLMRDQILDRPTSVDWVSGAAFLVRRNALEQVGLLDESLFHYFSDVDWAQRFWENGYMVAYYPMASLMHALGRTSKGRLGIFDPLVNQATRWHLKDAYRYFLKHGISGKRPNPTGPAQPSFLAA